jgi:hypothetical protein
LEEDVFDKEIQWEFFKYLNIDFKKIKVQGINFVLIPSKPIRKYSKEKESNLPDDLGLKKIEKFTSMYFANTTDLDYKTSQLHLIAPDYLKCSAELIYKLHKAFLSREL